jgi:hypothetical protein
MYKTLAIACIALFVASASAQASGSFCTKNGDCDQSKGLCCSAFAANSTFSPYTQFNCAAHVNGTATIKTQTCLANGTNGTVIDYTSVCASEAKTCINNATKYVSCGSSAAMFFIDTLNPSAVCTTASGAMSLAASAFFAVFAALALLF